MHKKSRFWPTFCRVLGAVCITLSFAAYYSAKWYVDVYGQMGFDAVLYTLRAGLSGTDPSLVNAYLSSALPKTLILSALFGFLFFFRCKKQIVLTLFQKLRLRLFPLSRLTAIILTVVLCCSLLLSAITITEIDEYLVNQNTESSIYEEQYRDPKTTAITFPEQKRNLVYILVESMETTFLAKKQGGALRHCAIPELYALAQEYTNFSHNANVGGFIPAPGATWTMGAMVGQTAGIPLKTPDGIDGNSYGTDGNFLPGVTTLTDILHENGYYQSLMVGSDASFGGRREYYTSHGIDRVYDLFTAREDHLVPEDYYVWWGFEDHYLFTYAKQALSEISQQDQPFAFTLLTVDTHHIGGYFCDYCEKTHDEQYEDVMQCTSKQVTAFVRWLQEQPFYENTTIIIAGDHPTMDHQYIARTVDEDFTRRIYNCFINAPVTTEHTLNRKFCAFDMMPTTLAAIGCTIEGDRLGFGTNLFSQTPTLIEATEGAILEELDRHSEFYENNFF